MLGYLIDMDGVVYRGNELIPGADAFIRALRAADVPFLFLTNNSQRTRRDVVTKLARLGIEVEEDHVFTSAVATARRVTPAQATNAWSSMSPEQASIPSPPVAG